MGLCPGKCLCPGEGLYPGRVFLSREGSLSGGSSRRRSLPGGGLCPRELGLCPGEVGLCAGVGSPFRKRVFVEERVSVQDGGLCPGGLCRGVSVGKLCPLESEKRLVRILECFLVVAMNLTVFSFGLKYCGPKKNHLSNSSITRWKCLNISEDVIKSCRDFLKKRH